MGRYQWTVGDLLTGKEYRTVELDGPSWSAVFDDADTISGKFNLRTIDPHTGEPIWGAARSEAAVTKSYLACAWIANTGAETMLAAGPIWTHSYSDDIGVLTVNAAGMETYFDHRKLIPVLAAGQTVEDVETYLTANQLGLVAKRLVQQARSHTGGQVPVVFPTDAELGGAGEALERSWPGYELASVGEELRSLAAADDGPEIQFVPRRRADDPRYIEWVMRIGTPATGYQIRQRGNPWLLDRTTTSGPITKADVNVDGTRMGDRAWAAGSGMGTGREISLAESTQLRGFGYPLLEVEASATDTVIETDTLASFTAAELKTASRPAETISLEVNADAFWQIAESARPGDHATLRIGEGHGYLDAGDHAIRILDMSGGGDTLTISCAERPGGI